MNEPTIEPGQRYWRALAPVWESVSIYEGPMVYWEQFSRLRPEIAVLFAAHWLNSEVCNGGFHQFFSNPTGVLAPEAHKSFLVLDLRDAAALIDQAIRFFGDKYPREQDVRCAMLDTIPGKRREEYDPFFTLDSLYYKLLPTATHRFALALDEYAERNDY